MWRINTVKPPITAHLSTTATSLKRPRYFVPVDSLNTSYLNLSTTATATKACVSLTAKITFLHRPVFFQWRMKESRMPVTLQVTLWSITAILFSIDCVSFILQLRSKQNSLPYYSECCEPCSFCHVNIFIQNLIQAFCVFYVYTFYTIGLPWLWDTCTVNMNLYPLKNKLLYTTPTSP